MQAAPRESAVKLMAAIWERVLRRAPVRPEDDFFDLGGDSLLAIALFAEIEKRTGRNLPITTIYDAPTVLSLAALLDRSAAPCFSPLVLLKPGSNETPLFIFHGLDGTVFELAKLGKAIKCERPVYAVQARGLDGREPPLDTVEGMAQYYLRAIRQFQPKGPYLFAGYSFGGLVALEAARLLMASSERPIFVGCLDTYIHPRYWPVAARVSVRARHMAQRIATLARSPIGATVAYIGERAKGAQTHEAAGGIAGRWFPVDLTLPLPLQRVHESSLAALIRYKPGFYPGRVVFFKPQRSLDFPKNPVGMWRKAAKELEVQVVAGDHWSMVGADSDDLAARLGLCIGRALTSAQTS
jgi:acetoacetyl-CoA synthetase